VDTGMLLKIAPAIFSNPLSWTLFYTPYPVEPFCQFLPETPDADSLDLVHILVKP
jgi:hypothetical protein